jgi:hypothetical protein
VIEANAASSSTTSLGRPDDQANPSTVRVCEANLKGAMRRCWRSVDHIITRWDADASLTVTDRRSTWRSCCLAPKK